MKRSRGKKRLNNLRYFVEPTITTCRFHWLYFKEQVAGAPYACWFVILIAYLISLRLFWTAGVNRVLRVKETVFLQIGVLVKNRVNASRFSYAPLRLSWQEHMKQLGISIIQTVSFLFVRYCFKFSELLSFSKFSQFYISLTKLNFKTEQSLRDSCSDIKWQV